MNSRTVVVLVVLVLVGVGLFLWLSDSSRAQSDGPVIEPESAQRKQEPADYKFNDDLHEFVEENHGEIGSGPLEVFDGTGSRVVIIDKKVDVFDVKTGEKIGEVTAQAVPLKAMSAESMNRTRQLTKMPLPDPSEVSPLRGGTGSGGKTFPEWYLKRRENRQKKNNGGGEESTGQ